MEYIVENLTDKEIDILIENDIEWFPDSLESRDAVIDGNLNYFNNVLKLIGRKE